MTEINIFLKAENILIEDFKPRIGENERSNYT